MRSNNVALGMVIGASLAVGIATSQSEIQIVQGQPQRVVASVNRGRVFQTPLVTRCLWMGIPAALVGAGLGHYLSNGANLAAACLGALTLCAMSASWRDSWTEKFGRAGANAQVSDSMLNGLVGALLGAAAAAHLEQHNQRLPRRLQSPEPADA